MRAKIILCKDHQEASLHAAQLLVEAIYHQPDMTVTFAAGDTPFACYRELIQRQEKGKLQLGNALYMGLDEWIGLGPDTPGSCIASMNAGYYRPAGIPPERVIAFDGLCADVDAEVKRMNKALEEHPLDLVVVGVGVNGHIGFNEPGIPTTGDFSLTPLSETTQTVGRKYFSGKDTPTQGATITLQALARAKQVIIIATGPSKREAVAAVLHNRADLPVCAFLDHPGAYYVFDEEATAEKVIP